MTFRELDAFARGGDEAICRCDDGDRRFEPLRLCLIAINDVSPVMAMKSHREIKTQIQPLREK